jgi:hypothetical protein
MPFSLIHQRSQATSYDGRDEAGTSDRPDGQAANRRKSVQHRVPTRNRSRRRVRLAASAAVILTLLAAGCGSKDEERAAAPASTGTSAPEPTTPGTPSSVETTTTAPATPKWPLTGTEADPAAMNIPIVVVKVDNSPWARPHAAINEADIVYELNVEGITRFMELFHSRQPERIGPIRSARSSDIDLFGNQNRPLLLWSGGNPGVTNEILGAQERGLVVDLGHGSGAGRDYYRDDSGGRFAPHDLFTNIAQIRAEFTPADAGPPAPMFEYRAPNEPVLDTSIDMPGMLIDFGLGVRVEYVWDPERNGWDRFQIDETHPRERSAFVDEGGPQIAPENVVILFLGYEPDSIDAHSPKALSVGEGDGVVMTAGRAINVHWYRGDPKEGWTLTERDTGAPVKLSAGRTWVALPDRDQDHVFPIDAGGAAQLLTLRA